MSGASPISTIRGIRISSTVFADDICIWAASDFVRQLNIAVQSALNDTVAKQQIVELEIATQKSCHMLLKAPCKCRRTLSLQMELHELRRAHERKILRVNIDAQWNGVAQARATIAATRCPANAIR